MAVTMAEITHLRKMSGAGMMDCKHALEEADHDFEKAMEIIRKKGQVVAAKRSDREASEGCVLAAVEEGFAAIVALKCETDFVAKNEQFIALTKDILDLAMAKKPASLAALLAEKMDKEGRSVQDHITDRIGVTGEKIELGYYEFLKADTAAFYVHPGNKLATIVAFNKPADKTVMHEVAMQVAAMAPVSVRPEEVPAKILDEEKEIARDKAREAGKPENLIDRIVEGALQKYYKENTLLLQEFVKDNKINIGQYLKQHDKELTVAAFKRVTLNME
ncbi:MAG: translation elongation factor Ts [Tannerella sp.]|nr:translation elongation factor Ts [Tannerella sp.]